MRAHRGVQTVHVLPDCFTSATASFSPCTSRKSRITSLSHSIWHAACTYITSHGFPALLLRLPSAMQPTPRHEKMLNSHFNAVTSLRCNQHVEVQVLYAFMV